MVASKPRLTYSSTISVPRKIIRLTVNPRCGACDKLLANYLAHPYSIQCSRCGALNTARIPAGEAPAATPEHQRG